MVGADVPAKTLASFRNSQNRYSDEEGPTDSVRKGVLEIMASARSDCIRARDLLFGGREVGCGFSGIYDSGGAEVHGTALVGRVSVAFRAKLRLLVPFTDVQT
jgi:hypothetical protein